MSFRSLISRQSAFKFLGSNSKIFCKHQNPALRTTVQLWACYHNTMQPKTSANAPQSPASVYARSFFHNQPKQPSFFSFFNALSLLNRQVRNEKGPHACYSTLSHNPPISQLQEPSSPRVLSQNIFLLSPIPRPPLYIGFAGLIPFVSTSLCAYLCSPEDAIGFQLLQVTYGASILGFLGAVHWGTAMAKYGDPSSLATRYALSVAPCILGFITLSCPPTIALVAQLMGFQFLLMGDFIAWRFRDVPDWYLNLRLWLTSIVTTCILATIWSIQYQLDPKTEQQLSKNEKET